MDKGWRRGTYILRSIFIHYKLEVILVVLKMKQIVAIVDITIVVDMNGEVYYHRTIEVIKVLANLNNIVRQST